MRILLKLVKVEEALARLDEILDRIVGAGHYTDTEVADIITAAHLLREENERLRAALQEAMFHHQREMERPGNRAVRDLSKIAYHKQRAEILERALKEAGDD